MTLRHLATGGVTNVHARRKGLPSADDLRELMKMAGQWMRAVRISTGLSQRQLLAQFPNKTPVFISDMEAGKIRLTPLYYESWARAVGLDPRQVAQVMIGFHMPFLYEPLFGEPFDPAQVIATTPPAFDNKSTAANIMQLRRAAKLSESQMAKQLGVSTRMYVAYEEGARRIPAAELERIAALLGVAASALTEAKDIEPTIPATVAVAQKEALGRQRHRRPLAT